MSTNRDELARRLFGTPTPSGTEQPATPQGRPGTPPTDWLRAVLQGTPPTDEDQPHT